MLSYVVYKDRKEHIMIFKDKKFIPYYITAAIIIILAIFFVAIIGIVYDAKEDETTTQETTTLFMNGEVPYYSDIPASAYETSSFVYDDNGRVVYNDESVKYSTGIDVSSHQGNINWEDVASDGIDFAILRVGYRGYGSAGNIRQDEMFTENAQKALDAGLKIGVYFYSQAITAEEAVEEAQFVIDIIEEYDIECPVVFDWENEEGIGMRTDNLSGDIITACAVSFCEKIKAAGYTPAVYFNLTDAYQRYDLAQISDYVFWYAQHEGDSPAFYYQYSIWQYSDSGSVNGIDGYVDMNICFESF